MNIIQVTKQTYFLSTFFWRDWYCWGTCDLLLQRQTPENFTWWSTVGVIITTVVINIKMKKLKARWRWRPQRSPGPCEGWSGRCTSTGAPPTSRRCSSLWSTPRSPGRCPPLLVTDEDIWGQIYQKCGELMHLTMSTSQKRGYYKTGGRRSAL